MLFKGFSLSILLRHWDRVLSAGPDASPADDLRDGNLLVRPCWAAFRCSSATWPGARSRDATGDWGESPEKLALLGAALARAGPVLGDMLLTGMGSTHGQSGASAAVGGVAGPLVGSAFELVYDVGLNNAWRRRRALARWSGSLPLVRGHAGREPPGISSSRIDQAFANQAQEFLSPGYLTKTEARMQRNYGSTWWWRPRDRGLLTGDMAGPARPELCQRGGWPADDARADPRALVARAPLPGLGGGRAR